MPIKKRDVNGRAISGDRPLEKKSVGVRLFEDHVRRLEKLGISRGEAVREALDEWLEKRGKI